MSKINISIGGTVGGTVNVVEGDAVIHQSGKRVESVSYLKCWYCDCLSKSTELVKGKCPHCTGSRFIERKNGEWKTFNSGDLNVAGHSINFIS